MCFTGTDCKSHKIQKIGTLACCKGKCAPLVADNANTGWCP